MTAEEIAKTVWAEKRPANLKFEHLSPAAQEMLIAVAERALTEAAKAAA